MSNDYIIQIAGVGSGYPTPVEGAYVKSFDPEARDGRGDVQLTWNRAEALGFETNVDAWETWRFQSKTVPWRPDGKPNRPMTAYTVTIERR